MAQAPTTSPNITSTSPVRDDYSQGVPMTGTCYTSDGVAVGVFLVNGQCPLGFFAEAPREEDNFSNDADSQEYSIADLLEDLVDFDPDEGETAEEEIIEVSGGQLRICYTACNANGNSSAFAFVGLDSCPVSHPFSQMPDCTEISDSLADLVDKYDELLAEAEGANAEQLQALQDKIANLQEAMQAPVVAPLPPPPAPQKAGFGGIPPWAILTGLGVVAVIAILGSRRRQPVVVQAK
ncbi:MAG: hypothetical protein CMI29_04625 [Opitutae bacterium]|nr:hypothetical protein [Opitutae bacterium]|tara:strand:- start:25084 stop:25794 length:711 start_codon:yes stop_codon:yes gene_type:complete